jgi:hypothetical protein
MSLKTKIFLTILIIVNLSFPLHATDKETILKLFKNSYNWSECVAFHAESVDSFSTVPTEQLYEESYFYNDHGRQISTLVTEQMKSFVTGEAVNQRKSRQTLFSEEKTNGYFHELYLSSLGSNDYSNPVILRSHEDGSAASYHHLEADRPLSSLLGMEFLFSNKRIPDLLEPDKVNLREESLDGRKSIVVETQVPEGHMEIWLSPEKGYSLQKYILTKEAGKDLDSDGEIYALENYADASLGSLIPAKRTIIEVVVEEEQYHEGSGYFIPKRHTWTYRNKNEDGDIFYENVSVRTLTEVDLNPDFEALQAFDFPVPDGTLVFLHKKNGQHMAGLKWQDGEFVIDVDGKALDDNIRTALAQLNAGSEAIQRHTGSVSLQMNGLDGVSGFLFRHGRLLTWISGALFLLACGAVGAFAYISGKEKTNLAATETAAVEESTTSTADRKAHE